MSLTQIEIDILKDVIVRASGNRFSDSQSYLLESRLLPVAKTAGLPDVSALAHELRRGSGGPLADQVAQAMTINETSFFRDQQPFDTLQNDMIPELLRRRCSERRLSIWSAASSSGQEAYSIAMVVREAFPQLETWDVEIAATDLSDEMVERVREGRYSQYEVGRGLPARFLVKYFERTGLNWVIRPEIRRLVKPRKLNLLQPGIVTKKYDVVFLRNVLIYFDEQSKLQILNHIRQSMRDDGYLILGGGETLFNSNLPFQRSRIANCGCFQPTTAEQTVSLPSFAESGRAFSLAGHGSSRVRQ
ncbi:MAG: protein-glutamate O-methyltransferase CheR [Planctomycetaceae bacterium]|nr:protein-glutamate O-methyltransferase CheR [Planctomycetaceae bacterium]